MSDIYFSFSLRADGASDSDDADRITEDGQAAEVGASRQEVGPLLRVRSCCPLPPHVHVRPHRPLAGLYLVRHREHGAHRVRAPGRHEDRLAGQPGRPDREALQQQRQELGPLHQGQVRHGSVLHLQQPDQRGVRQRVAQHQPREDLLHLRHAHRL